MIESASSGATRTAAPHGTHEVFNQPAPYGGYNLLRRDHALREGLEREGASWAVPRLDALAADLADPEVIRHGYMANRYVPELHTHDNYGHRINEVQLHHSWHELMRLARRHEVHSLPWTRPQSGSHVARAASSVLMAQVESGTLCPLHMTYAGVPVLRNNPALAAQWEPRLTSTGYDPRYRPVEQKQGALIGMAMTEKQGGSDLRANTTVARPTLEEGVYELSGHKWFFSAPMVDCFLTVAHVEGSPGQISCFFVPFWLPDGTRNRFSIMRLKDKLGNRSNPSSEIEYNGTLAWRVGDEGKGIRTIIEMVSLTRLGCASISAGIMRQTLLRALHHTQQRSAFGAKLVDKPLMSNVLADLSLESEAATALVMRLAGSIDRAATDAHEARFSRVVTAITKYWLAKRASPSTFEALECHGGFGYIEDSMMPRFYREAPVQSVWEGSGNVICLDVLRAIDRDHEALEPVLREIELARGLDPHLDAVIAWLRAATGRREQMEGIARRLVEMMALGLQASLLLRFSPSYVSQAFCASRLGHDWGFAFGTLGTGVAFKKIIERAWAAEAG
ncbi:acyl-CoA dehydrogenase family protein [Xenophilus arseniciresistens]|uniref:Acyl-CoA dehydrogenase family protein n=1 Tax=Xenophilus arseniciresistens TaxID=1283306 RepID=A0AAE3NA97_9BURK|nr:acyl-CoA dehydrogenase family protein [Xenophilus arseniciresistens]MDA7416024.1 acyl-CoA dehydrogenase family protein [Xenophilus arseniciresistens]